MTRTASTPHDLEALDREAEATAELFRQELCDELLRARISTEALADVLDCDLEHLEKKLAGEQELPLLDALAICGYIGVKMSDLLARCTPRRQVPAVVELSLRTAAASAGLSPDRLREVIRGGDLTALPAAGAGRLVVDRDELIRWLQESPTQRPS